MIYVPGPGDSFPPFSGHPHDPRTPEDDSNDTTAEAIDMVHTLVRSAIAAEIIGNRAKAKQKMVEARDMINELIGLRGSR